jgi:hypothetical protein
MGHPRPSQAGQRHEVSAERRKFSRKDHADIEGFTRTGRLASWHARYIRLVRFSFLTLISRFATLIP